MFIHPYRYKNLHHIQNTVTVDLDKYIMPITHRKNDSTEAFSVYFEKLTSSSLQYKVIRAINGTFKLMLSFF